MFRVRLLLASLAVMFVVSGCERTQPVYNVIDAPIITSSSSALTIEQVRGAITKAAQEKRWRVQQMEEGHIVATIIVRKHTAVVDINYTATDYDITYKDSNVLLYDGQRIHRNYNKWIKLLDERISQNLNAL